MLQMRAAQSENHEARMRLIRSLALNAGPPLPGHTTETHEALAMNWLLSALQVEYMLEPLGRVIKGDGGLHVDLGEVMDKPPDARATKGGIPTIGALFANTPPPKFTNVSGNPSHLQSNCLPC